MRGKLIVFEGLDGAGKTSTIDWLCRRVSTDTDWRIVRAVTPGGTGLGMTLRHELLRGRETLEPMVQDLLFAADYQHILSTLILPSLQEKNLVILDRGIASAYAYGLTRDRDSRDRLDVLYDRRITANLNVLLDIDIQTWRTRLRPKKLDNVEPRDGWHANQVREVYQTLAKTTHRQWGPWVTIDARPPAREVQEAVWQAVEPHLAA